MQQTFIYSNPKFSSYFQFEVNVPYQSKDRLNYLFYLLNQRISDSLLDSDFIERIGEEELDFLLMVDAQTDLNDDVYLSEEIRSYSIDDFFFIKNIDKIENDYINTDNGERSHLIASNIRKEIYSALVDEKFLHISIIDKRISNTKFVLLKNY